MRHPLTIIVQGRVKFQSTHSLRSATVRDGGFNGFRNVSIHALLAECDWTEDQTPGSWKSFNPRTPCGVRLVNKVLAAKRNEFQSTHSLRSATLGIGVALLKGTFQSTHSLRSATQQQRESVKPLEVSIHALLAECDFSISSFRYSTACFNPRTPCGVRLVYYTQKENGTWFQSTHSLRSATIQGSRSFPYQWVSIHALLAECDCA